MHSIALPLPLAAPAAAHPHRNTLSQALAITGHRALDPAAVRAHMVAERAAHQSPLWRRAVALVFGNRVFGVAIESLALCSLVAVVLSGLAGFVCCLCHLFGGDISRIGPMTGQAFCVSAAALIAFCVVGVLFDGFSASFACWRVSDYRANDVPVWVRKVAGDVRRACPGLDLRVHRLYQNEVIVDPVLEAVCPVTKRSVFLAVWDDKGRSIGMPEAA
jgi:hypothetical protein